MRELREGLSDALGRAGYGNERVQVTRNGKPAAVIIGLEDFALLEELEMLRDLAELRSARAADDGTRVSLAELLAEVKDLASTAAPAAAPITQPGE